MSSPKQPDRLLYRQTRSVKAGQVERFKIHYTPYQESVGIAGNNSFTDSGSGTTTNTESKKSRANSYSNSSDITDAAILAPPASLWVKIRNVENIAMRAAFLAGPHILYVDCRSDEYDQNKKCFITADQPVYEPQLLPGQSFYAQLSCHTIKNSYSWVVDVVSQIIFNNTIDVDFEIMIGTSKAILHDCSNPDNKVVNADKTGTFVSTELLNVSNQDTFDLWNLPVPDATRPIHLVILTHGLHSNVTTDMLYLKEQIDNQDNGKDNVVVKGYMGNIGKTERGIKYLGSRVAEFVVDLVTNNESFNNGRVTKISFIGHSLGGLVQTFAIAYLQVNFPTFFRTIRPINFIALASPMLGIVNENPVYIRLALLAGVVGITGRDMGLKFVEADGKPLLLLLPSGPTHQVLKRFARRTVYSNAVNDGIVPMRTSSLLFLDYRGILQIVNSPQATTPERADDPKTTIVPTSLMIEEQETPVLSPVQAMLSYLLPQKQSKKADIQRFQTKEVSGSTSGETLDVFPTVGVLETAASLILPPLPSLKFITNPDARVDPIVHDKVYSEDDLPPSNDSESALQQTENAVQQSISHRLSMDLVSFPEIRKRLLSTIDYDVEHLEEEIAREYHKDMTWRKVVVKLKADAHNSIIVRRRFANAYGWPVIDHLVKNHFAIEDEEPEATQETGTEIEISKQEDEEDDLGLSTIVSRDLITRQNKEIDSVSVDENEICEHHWINSKDSSNALFSVGPTGMLAEVTEMVGNIRDQIYNYGVQQPNQIKADGVEGVASLEVNEVQLATPRSTEFDSTDELGIAKRVMGGFI
ncbi:hypothetical protein G9P44_000228 [Scheffersomyces stipitis]|nr:hypothetical protein G9P44_000228 [Scheffersomyces stipitis]